MKILCLIDHFGSGGAQRQMVYLALGLKSRGHAVEMFIFHPQFAFFRYEVECAGIPIHVGPGGRLRWIKILLAFIRLVKKRRFDAIVSFLGTPNLLAELSSIASPRTLRIVSERSSQHDDKSWLRRFGTRLFHVFATRVVSNSQAHAEWLRGYFWLRKKVITIYNGLPLPNETSFAGPARSDQLRLVVIGRVGPEKNGLGLIKALALFHRRNGFVPRLQWVGKRDLSVAGRQYTHSMEQALMENPAVNERWEWLGERNDIPKLLAQNHVLIHPSFYEGLPNVICEAMAAGLPVLASNVCDHPSLVQDGIRGFLFNPNDPSSIADSIEKLLELSLDDLKGMSSNARSYAKSCLGLDLMIDKYDALLTACKPNQNN